MTWTCELTETRLGDYLDGLLEDAEQTELQAHAEACRKCRRLLVGVERLVGTMHEMESIDPPPRLVYAILDKTLGPRETVSGWRGWRNRLRALATPRFAYGAASLVATILILLGSMGMNLRKPKLADLQPGALYRNADRKLHLASANVVKYVSDLRVVYEIQSRLRQDQNELPVKQEERAPVPSPEKKPGKSDDQTESAPRQQNRAHEFARQMELLAAECPVVWERSAR